jgi:hypothetical protein
VHIRRTEIPTLVKAYGLGIDGQLRGRGADVRDDPALDVARMPSGGPCRGPPRTPAIRTAHRGEIRADRRQRPAAGGAHIAREVRDDAGSQKRRKATRRRGAP